MWPITGHSCDFGYWGSQTVSCLSYMFLACHIIHSQAARAYLLLVDIYTCKRRVYSVRSWFSTMTPLRARTFGVWSWSLDVARGSLRDRTLQCEVEVWMPLAGHLGRGHCIPGFHKVYSSIIFCEHDSCRLVDCCGGHSELRKGSFQKVFWQFAKLCESRHAHRQWTSVDLRDIICIQ